MLSTSWETMIGYTLVQLDEYCWANGIPWEYEAGIGFTFTLGGPGGTSIPYRALGEKLTRQTVDLAFQHLMREHGVWLHVKGRG